MRIKTLVCGALLVPMLAVAQPKSADDWYKEGETQYNLGNFDKAADAFKQGFALETVESKKAAYLYNVAQAYRQGGKCRDALFFYKRYLALKDADTAKPLSAEKRDQTERLIQEQEDCVKKLDANASSPPNTTLPPEGGTGSGATTTTTTTTTGHSTTGTGTTGHGNGSAVVAQVGGSGGDEGSDSGEEEPSTPTVLTPPKMLNARFDGGGALISAGSALSIPIKPSFALVAGYPVLIQDKLEIDAGIAAAYTPLPYTNYMTMAKQNGSFTSLLADAGATYFVAPKIGLRGDLGLGVLVFGGITDAGNPFTQNGASTSGALTMFAVRAAVSGDYLITNNVFATVTPLAFTYSPPKSGLRDDIKSITRLDFMVGVGYRM